MVFGDGKEEAAISRYLLLSSNLLLFDVGVKHLKFAYIVGSERVFG
jgi:hypothetical protein